MTLQLLLDGEACDLGTAACAVPGYSAAKIADVDACREGRSLRITIPPTSRNGILLGNPRDPHTGSRFNAALRTATLAAEGSVLLSGTVRLLAASDEGFTLEIRDGGAGWAEQASRRMFDALEIDYRETLSPETIRRSWSDSSPVKFFPIHRDEYPQLNSSQDLLTAERLLTVDDYHPFLHVATLVERIFAQAGYRIESRFLQTPFFRQLYLSGAYSSRDTTAQQARMGFYARRLAPATATASPAGWVYADPKASVHTVGNLVDTATPQTLDADGEAIPGLFNNGGSFGVENGMIRFVVPTQVSAGFEYYLKYTTDHRILSRTQLRGFDSVYLGPGSELRFTLANRYEDRRRAIRADYAYRAIVFDHAAGAQYRLTCTLDGAADTLWTTFSARSAAVTTPASGTPTDPVLWVRSDSGWVRYAGDWALYDGYIGETGTTTVELRIRTAAEAISPASPKYFYAIHFFGAEAGMSLTLHKECSLQPRFLSGPGYGSTIRFADVARHRIRQSELLQAVGHLFNLRFYTEEATRRVFIEPADDFFGAGTEADWRAKSDFSQPVVLEEMAPGIHELRTWCYQEGDGAVTRYETEHDTEVGVWSFRTESYGAKMGEEVLRNPLFRPTLSSTGHYANAPSARLLQVGDRDATGHEGTEIAPRIVRYTGMHPLPEGERWGYPSHEAAYPLAAFHFPGDDSLAPFTLCFEDRDGAAGLHRYYDRQAAQEATRERITLSLRLAPHEFAALLAPGTGAPDIRSVFLLDTGGDTVRATLHAVEEYDPAKGSVRCTFTRLPED
ncbi:MAG: hypothetical protein NC322_04415 [Alistipes senegalensis]|nr:hypothetical protein [Alistipes senegalensis]